MSGITSLPYRDFLGRVNELVNRSKIKNNNFRYHENAVKALNLLSKNVNIVNSREKHLLKRTSLIEVADFKENKVTFFDQIQVKLRLIFMNYFPFSMHFHSCETLSHPISHSAF